MQEGVAGTLPLRVEGVGGSRTIAVRTPRARLVERTSKDDVRIVRAITGMKLGPLPPALMDGGRRWWLTEIVDEASLRSIDPAWGAISQLAQRTDSMGVCAFAKADPGSDYDLVVRAFVGATAQFEDAASGAANATLAAWLAQNERLPGRDGRYVVSQGREVGFDARLQLHVDEAGDVWSGGHVRTVVTGSIDW
jgi:PhzF family phenazine biosynthesis protein